MMAAVDQFSRLGADIAGLFFLAMAITYRGSVRGWWSFFAPLGLVFLFGPVARWESGGWLGHSGVFRVALVPGLSFVGGCLIASVRDTVIRAIEGAEELRSLRRRGVKNIEQIHAMGGDVNEIIHSLSASPPGQTRFVQLPEENGNWEKIEYRIEEGALRSYRESETMSHEEIKSILTREMNLASHAVGLSRRTSLHFIAPLELPIPLAVRGESETFARAFRGLLQFSIDSLAGNDGNIRLSLRPSLSAIDITIEDNGRGLSEAMIVKLEAKGLMKSTATKATWSEIRHLAALSGWNLELQARLGVGSRVCLSLPRVDAFTYGARALRARSRLDEVGMDGKLSPSITSSTNSDLQPG